ncbi:hypothetical protein DPEC_G00024740 [Dallia pectoralis]|uniref:Uncharacterized protein n=1 Tax=Dallia pectoralis TaxID=75939 RepID=A0ACC2HH58_DALPE|nr:hypothetical protein DPEC_G00024740 [Dallia pectoralis]
MEDDVISLSSGSDVDSDVEVVGVYSDTENKAEARPFIRGGWVNLAAYTPFVIDIRPTGQKWTLPQPRKHRRKIPDGPVEVVDLSDNLSDHSGPVLGSPECQGNRRREISKHKGPHTRSPVSLSHSSPEPELNENIADLKAEESDILESDISSIGDSSLTGLLDDNSNGKTADIGIKKCPLKSPSRPKPDLPVQKTDVSGATTKQYSGIAYQPLCEEKEKPQCLKPETKNSHFPNDVQTSCTFKVQMVELKVQEIVTIDKPVCIKKKEEPGFSKSLLDSDLLLSPKSLVDRPYKFIDGLDPEHSRSLCGFVGLKTYQHNDTCNYPTPIPSETSLFPPPAETLHVNLSDPAFNPTSPASKHYSKQDTVYLNSPSTKYINLRPCSPFIEPDKHVPQVSSHDYPHLPPLTASFTSPGPSTEKTYQKHEGLTDSAPSPSSTAILAGQSPDWPMDETEVDLAKDCPPIPYMCKVLSDPLLSLRSEKMDKETMPRSTEAPQAVLGPESLLTTTWRDESDEEEMCEERGDGEVDTVVNREDNRYVCPAQLKKLSHLMSGPVKDLEKVEEEDDGIGDPEPLCRQSLSLVYSTMEENYPEGTLQLLSDLLQPRFFPPIDITRHLLRGILLDPQCPNVLCLEAYSLLMRTQKHYPIDNATIPWDWELLTSVLAEEQSEGKRLRCEVVRMLLQYVVQTMEDDFRVKLSFRDLHRSIASATISCNSRFNQVRDVISWLFAAIVKSVGDNNNMPAGIIKMKTQKEHLKMVFLLQKLLSMALEVDLLPAVNSCKLSGELFHMIISTLPLRHHRLLLLETLESRLLRCKLTEHLLRYASPEKTPLPMSLKLLLHFLNNATLTPDPTNEAESWKKWEELVQLLWMLLLSYKEVMKCELRMAVTERRGNGRIPTQAKSELVLRLAVEEAVESFLSRSHADLGQALPPHVHESLTYLKEHLLASSC